MSGPDEGARRSERLLAVALMILVAGLGVLLRGIP